MNLTLRRKTSSSLPTYHKKDASFTKEEEIPVTNVFMVVLDQLANFEDVMLDEHRAGLPLIRGIQHSIDLVLRASLSNLPHYRMSHKEREILLQMIEDLQKKGMIQVSMSLCTIPAMLTPEKDGCWHKCVDGRAISMITVRYRFLISRLEHMLDRFFGAWITQKYS